MARTQLLEPLSRHELFQFINDKKIVLPIALDISARPDSMGTSFADGTVQIAWSHRVCHYIFKYSRHNTPKALEEASLKVEKAAEMALLPPLLIAPYLDEEKLTLLRARNISALDLCGNASLTSNDYAIWQTGRPNIYKTSSSIKNIFSGRSSIFARCFLIRDEFESLTKLWEFAQTRLPEAAHRAERRLTLSTASKVVKALEQMLMVTKQDGRIRVLDSEKLATELLRNYNKPKGRSFVGKAPLSRDEIWHRVSSAPTVRCIATGEASATKYGVLGNSEKLSLYVQDLPRVLDVLSPQPTQMFPNLELIEEPSEEVYFDCRKDGNEAWASPVQTWLELASGGPREKEAAEILGSKLKGIERNEASHE